MQEVWKDIDAHAKRWIRDAGEHLMASMKSTYYRNKIKCS